MLSNTRRVGQFDIPRYAEAIKPLIGQAIDQSDLRILMDEDHILSLLAQGAMQLWLTEDTDGTLAGIGITELVEFPKGLRLVHYMSSVAPAYKHRVDLEACLVQHVDWGRSMGCVQVFVSGRVGWKKIYESQGFQTPCLSMSKRLI